MRVPLPVQPELIRAATTAVLRLVSCCGLGVVAARRQVLDQTAVTALSRLIFNIFQPALLFTNVAKTLASPSHSYRSLVVLPVFAICQIFIGSIYGKVLSKALNYPKDSDQGRELAICSSFANSGPLPLLFVDTLFKNHVDPTILPRAVAYISFYLLAWSPLFWTWGSTLLVGHPTGQGTPLVLDGNTKPTFIQKFRQWWSDPLTRRVFSPPTMGCILGAIAGSLPFFRNLLMAPNAPLLPVFESLKTLGTAYLPAVLLVLAGSLAQGLKSFDMDIVWKVGALMVSRFCFMPLTAMALLQLGIRGGFIPDDHLLWFVLLMQSSMPSAQNTVVILQLEKKPEAAASMARLISTMYVLAIFPMGILLSAMLQYVKL